VTGRRFCEHYADKLVNVISVKTLSELNDYIAKDYKHVYIKRRINPELYSDYDLMTFRNKQTGLYSTGRQREPYMVQYGREISFPEAEWDLVQTIQPYEGIHPEIQPWGAYIIPKELEPMESVYIPDLIEDFLLTSFWDHKIRADDGVGIWTGKNIQVDKSLFDSYQLIG
jgi:hypothetical protein